MAGSIFVELKSVRLFAFVGVHAQEKKVANEFEVDMSIELNAPEQIIKSITETINYVDVYATVKKVFDQKHQLLETCAMEIANQINTTYSEVKSISISIKKISPAINNFIGSVGVSYKKNYKQ